MIKEYGYMEDKDENVCPECGADCSHEDFDLEDAIITMVDQETGEEYDFIMADEFEFDGEVYCLLMTTDSDEPSALFVRVVEGEDGVETYESLEDDEFDRVAEEYDRLCELEGTEEDLDSEE